MKAHSGIEGNELADHLAKEVGEDEGELHTVYNRTPLTTVATNLREEGRKDSQNGRDNGKAPTKERSAGRSSQQ